MFSLPLPLPSCFAYESLMTPNFQLAHLANWAKRSQHANTAYHNIVGHSMLRSFGHFVATCCDMLGVVGSNLTSFKLEPTTPNMLQHIATRCILVPRAHDPSDLWQGSRALAWSNTGSPRFTDFPSNLIGREYETNALRILRKSGPARALDPCHRPEGSWALGTRINTVAKRTQHVAPNNVVICCVDMLQLFGGGFKNSKDK